MSMVEKLAQEGQLREQAKRSEAESFIKEKHLWLVPTWRCNRDETKDNRGICAICFAKDIMHHAGANGYKDPQADFYEKAKALTRLSWKDVILTGGEPTLNRESLKATLAVIDSQRNVRIITNGDWILKEESREEVISIIKSSGLKVMVEVSTHDSFEVFKRKIEGLKEKGIKIGAQLRMNERGENGYLSNFLEREKMIKLIIDVGGNVEEHGVLMLGQSTGRKQQDVLLNLKKLIDYARRERNVGTYLMPGKNGTRVIVNHETPYIVFPTPADIASADDSPEKVVEKVINYYAASSVGLGVLDDTAIAYAKAEFMAGVPLGFSGYEIPESDREGFDHISSKVEERIFLDGAKKLMDMYYELASEKLQIPVDKLKELIAEKIAEHLLNLVRDGYKPSAYSGFGELSAPFLVGRRPDLLSLPQEEGISGFVQNASDLMGGHNLMGKPFDVLIAMKDPKFLAQLDVLGIEPYAVAIRLSKSKLRPWSKRPKH